MGRLQPRSSVCSRQLDWFPRLRRGQALGGGEGVKLSGGGPQDSEAQWRLLPQLRVAVSLARGARSHWSNCQVIRWDKPSCWSCHFSRILPSLRLDERHFIL